MASSVAAAVVVDVCDYGGVGFNEKVLLFLKNTIQQFWCICDANYCHRRLFFLRNIVLDFENILDGFDPAEADEEGLDSLGGAGRLDVKYRSWLTSCIIHIRDIRFGYGIRDIAYALLVVWYRRFPSEADSVMRRFVYDVGCWSDIKRFLGLWRELGGVCGGDGGGGDVVRRVVSIMIDQLWLDYGDYGKFKRPCSHPCSGYYISIAAKWIPREKSSYGWLYDYFVIALGNKAGWSGGCMDCWRRDFRKIVSGLCQELNMQGSNGQSCVLLEAKDFVRMAYKGGGDGGVDESGWRAILDRFCSGVGIEGELGSQKVCSLAVDTIPVVELNYYDFGTDDFWRAISYAILIAQRGIGRFMLVCGYGGVDGYLGGGVGGYSWIVCRREDNLLDIVARIRGVVGGVGGGGIGGAMNLLRDASELSGVDLSTKLFFIRSGEVGSRYKWM